jgi:hypothetical protein
VRIHGYVLKPKGLHKLKSLGSTDINDVSCSFISIWQIFFGKCFVQFPMYFHSLKRFSVFSCIKNGLSLSHVSVFCCFRIYFYFILFIFPKTKLQIIVTNRYWLTSIVNTSIVIKHYTISRNKMCEKLCFIFCARKMMYVFLILV